MISPASRIIRCINSRAVVDLPQPDSPTILTVSPLAMAGTRTYFVNSAKAPFQSSGGGFSL
jgi:hypothetical protein